MLYRIFRKYKREAFALRVKCIQSDSIFLIVYFRFILNKIINSKSLQIHQNVTIKGIKNIDAKENIEIGIGHVGFIHKTDLTYLNINGILKFTGNFSIGRGCRFDIGKDAIVTIGKNGYITCNTTLIIMHELTIGDNCAISWDCQFLDEDFHEIIYPERKNNTNSIIIGDNVWIGCGVKVFKGSIIPNGSVIASYSTVKGVFIAENSLIGGNPAKVLKEKIKWR